MPGPPPTPHNLLAPDSFRRGLGSDEPSPDVKIPTPPTWLCTRGRAEWKRLTRELKKVGLITELDRTILALHCNAVADVAQLRRVIEEGVIVRGPEIARMNDAIYLLMKTGQQFGLTPSSRRGLRLQRPTPPAKDPRGRKRKKILRMA